MKIIALGCSFTEKYPRGGDPWPTLISNVTGHKVINYGKSGTGNRYAYNKLINHLINEGPVDKVYWLMSEFDRVDLCERSVYPIDFDNDPNYLKFVKEMLETQNNSNLELWNEKIKNEGKISAALSITPFEHWIDSNIILIHNIQKICKSYGIELKIIQGLRPLNYYLSHYDESLVANAMLNSRYIRLLDFKTTIGYPWMKIAGGNCLVEKHDWMKKYSISLKDDHPSQRGHQLIADMFLK